MPDAPHCNTYFDQEVRPSPRKPASFANRSIELATPNRDNNNIQIGLVITLGDVYFALSLRIQLFENGFICPKFSDWIWLCLQVQRPMTSR